MAKKRGNNEIKVPETLALVAGILLLIAAIVSLIMGNAGISFWFKGLGAVANGVWGIVFGVIALVGYWMLKDSDRSKVRSGAAIVLIIGIITLILGQGWLVGPILAIIGGAMGIGVK